MPLHSGGGEGGGGYFLLMDKWGCAAGWGHIFTAGLTIRGFDFQQSYRARVLWGTKILADQNNYSAVLITGKPPSVDVVVIDL